MKRSRIMVFVAVLAASLCVAGSLRSATAPGAMLWEKTFTFPNCDTILIGGVIASTNSLIVCGTAFDSNVDTGDIGFIKAFDQAAPGTVLWEKTLTEASGGGHNRNSFNSLAVVGNTVVVEGYSSSYTLDSSNNYVYTLNQTSLRAYNAYTGTESWPSPVNKTAAAINVGPINMVSANNKVFVVRQQNYHRDPPSATGACIVEAYQVSATNAPATSMLLE